MQGKPSLAKQIGVIYQDDTVIHDNPHEDQKPYCGEDVKGGAGDEVNRHNPYHREGYSEDNDERVFEGFKKAGHDPKDQEYRHYHDKHKPAHHPHHVRIIPVVFDDHIILRGDFRGNQGADLIFQEVYLRTRHGPRSYMDNQALIFPADGHRPGSFPVRGEVGERHSARYLAGYEDVIQCRPGAPVRFG
ncbi:hypothetical protein Holit_03409 [Hollandina sp. SP2]